MKKFASTAVFMAGMVLVIAASLSAWASRGPSPVFRDPAVLASTARDREFLTGFAANVIGAPETVDRLHYIAKKIEYSEKLDDLDRDFLALLAKKTKNPGIAMRLRRFTEKY